MTGAFTFQPFVSDDGKVVTVFNGEIYNYLELAQTLGAASFPSDGYAILPAYERWGLHFVQHLHGEFAIVVVDFRRRWALLSTDAFSTKPLWYATWYAGGGWRFVTASYESVLTRLGAPAHTRTMAEPNEALVLSLDGVAGSGSSVFGQLGGGHPPMQPMQRLPLFTWDLRQHKTHTRDWVAAFREAVQIRTARIKHNVFITVSGGYDSGAIMLALKQQQIPFLAYSIRGKDNVSVMRRRSEQCKPLVQWHLLNFSAADYENERSWMHKRCEPFTYHSFRSFGAGLGIGLAAGTGVGLLLGIFAAALTGRGMGVGLRMALGLGVCIGLAVGLSVGEGKGKAVADDAGAIGMSRILAMARRKGALVYLSGNGADEIISDYAANGKRIAGTSYFGGVFPADLEKHGFFPWPSFYKSTQRDYLMKEELTAGAHGVEGRYPFLDPNVVQEYLWLSHHIKNSEYKRPIADFLRQEGFPNSWNMKVGFSADKNLQ